MSQRSYVRRAAHAVLDRAGGPLRSVTAVRTERPEVVLTFDDGPEPGSTEAVLDALADAGAKATFFVLLTRVTRYRPLFKAIISEGHEIALHGSDHRRLTGFAARDVHTGLLEARERLSDAAGTKVRWFRPPYGAGLPSTHAAIRMAGLQSALWGRTTWDWKPASQDQRLAKALDGIHSGEIILAHDGHAGRHDLVDDGPAPDVDKGELVRLVIDGLRDKGLSPTSLGEALRGGDPVLSARFVR
ncbi:polysaccharide deacetylase family protein [Epidermidibacterium keratini]|uniref:Polysaccharide deacetylase family protein n=1 Tax=Epidermidibacterium keratini TaxID=1891644 RepID=A0A7L4YMS9_9ACTN|nr:polysaccharide deacetylase family protein [Epidermidibacterium keratini]QHC00144.1 polysaccharide deacetylase family protein [Epidermidibacterium keratini]